MKHPYRQERFRDGKWCDQCKQKKPVKGGADVPGSSKYRQRWKCAECAGNLTNR